MVCLSLDTIIEKFRHGPLAETQKGLFRLTKRRVRLEVHCKVQQ